MSLHPFVLVISDPASLERGRTLPIGPEMDYSAQAMSFKSMLEDRDMSILFCPPLLLPSIIRLRSTQQNPGNIGKTPLSEPPTSQGSVDGRQRSNIRQWRGGSSIYSQIAPNSIRFSL